MFKAPHEVSIPAASHVDMHVCIATVAHFMQLPVCNNSIAIFLAKAICGAEIISYCTGLIVQCGLGQVWIQGMDRTPDLYLIRTIRLIKTRFDPYL